MGTLVTIGSPPQLVYPAIDLFATNIWVNPDCYAAYDYEACCKNGDYNPDASISAGEQDCSQPWGFSTPYGDASGCTVVDDVQFAGKPTMYHSVSCPGMHLILTPSLHEQERTWEMSQSAWRMQVGRRQLADWVWALAVTKATPRYWTA